MSESADLELDLLELELLFQGVFRHYGIDFRDYARTSLRRRVALAMEREQVETVSALQDKVLHDRACLDRLIKILSVHVSAMFRDPSFYLAFRKTVVPMLRTYPFIRIWHAACSSGEEVYSMAILLREEGIYDRCRIYATDMSEEILKTARDGIFRLEDMQKYTANYLKAGGTRSFSEYYRANDDGALFSSELRDNVVFAPHNLAQDRSLNEFNAILCRNVLIYFNKDLQNKVYGLLHESLSLFGVLALGKMESMRFTMYEPKYETLDDRQRIYRKVIP